ncbi:unnamed protein product [Ceutorhynchus assimilis]|uniref:alkaline phosphatase n=1 Tax=Ceutorhynchus assimilis TaxID=467358 RepID=A0A9N9MYL2_9CUCU|nr:unnamed protein product [Ceutorhynchus assimilis]
MKIFLKFLVLFASVYGCFCHKEEKDDVISTFKNKAIRSKSRAEIYRETTKEFWKHEAIKAVKDRLKRRLNFNTAKNVIFLMGDGMSISTISATRVYMGGEEMSLAFDTFPYTGLCKTYCVDNQTPDSACSATAYLGGVKANLGTIGVTAAVQPKNCTAARLKENRVDSLARIFQLDGRKTGLVTTTRVTHASPAGIYAHTSNRHWESDSDVIKSGKNPSDCEDIAHQLVFGETGQNLNVILGGGSKYFLPQTDEQGIRLDQENLIEEWQNIKKRQNKKFEYVWNKKQLMTVDNVTDYLLGLFNSGHMDYNLDRNKETVPSLEEMTEAAIKILSKDNTGYFLFVEGGRIDTAHHFNLARKAIDETAEFSKAIQKAVDLTNQEDTLIIVTADHAHTMSYAGYAERGSDIFGFAGTASDNLPYTILNYANGPGYKPTRQVPTITEIENKDFVWPATAPRQKETHGAEDVGVYAKGPWAHFFTGVMEQNVLPYLITLASCINPDFSCKEIKPKFA